jgi:hypothetical protein
MDFLEVLLRLYFWSFPLITVTKFYFSGIFKFSNAKEKIGKTTTHLVSQKESIYTKLSLSSTIISPVNFTQENPTFQ